MVAHFLAEAGGITGEGLGQFALVQDGVDEFADHGVLAGADEIQVLPFDLVHHVLHLGEAHHAIHHAAADHEGGHIIFKALVDHEIPGIGQNGGMEPGHITPEVIKAVAAGFPCAVQIDAQKALHDVHMIGHGVIGHLGLAEFLQLHIFAVVTADGHRGVNDIGNDQHPLADLFIEAGGLFFQLLQLLGHGGDLALGLLGLFALALGHQLADLLADGVPLGAEIVTPGFGRPALLVQFDHLIHQLQLFLLEFFADVLFHRFRVHPQEFHVQHFGFLLLQCSAGPECFFPEKKKKPPIPFPMGRKTSAVPPMLPA